MIGVPKKPFPEYKWRWATFTPTEGLNEPPIFLGVLRAMRKCETSAGSSKKFLAALTQVETETADNINSTVILARDPKRNLLRNSQQYWKFLGVLETTRGGIKLTPFGRSVADGNLSQREFAAATVNTLTLPHKSLKEDVKEWGAAGLQIKPLLLILRILLGLGQHGSHQRDAYITREELIRMVIPMAGAQWDVSKQVEAIRAYRNGKLAIAAWPVCATNDNERRMAREFLLFLEHYGFISVEDDDGTEKFYLNIEALEETEALDQLMTPTATPAEAADLLRASPLFLAGVRRRILVGALQRTAQPAFRREVLKSAGAVCLITGERLEEVLEAAHIVPVSRNGTDNKSNGLCLRTDIHTLFDAGHLRIKPSGAIVMSDRLKGSVSYASLPTQITIPPWVHPQAIPWRWNYQ